MEYKAASEVSRQALVQAGLTPHQAAVYEALIQHGSQKATRLAFLAGVPRTLSYKVLDELEAEGLVVKKDEPGKVSVFVPAHPLKLKELTDRRLEEAKGAKTALEGTLGKLISDFNTAAGSPGVRILEGVAGLAELLEDELNERQSIRLIRSHYDMDAPELNQLMNSHIQERVKLKIPVRSIGPKTAHTPQALATDAGRFVERRVVEPESLSIPASVVIYANKVGITSYKGSLMTTIIENTAIRQTFELIFEYMWAAAEPEHQKILQGLEG